MPEPEFESRAEAFRIVFRRVASTERVLLSGALNDRQRALLLQLRREQRLTRADYQRLTRAVERTARRDLEQLVARKLVTRIGAGKNASCRLAAVSKEA